MSRVSRRTVLSAAGVVTAAGAGAADATTMRRLRIVTFNIYLDSDPSVVQGQLNQLVDTHRADVLLLQECTKKSLQSLFGNGHPDWAFFHTGTGDGRADPAVLWRRSISRRVLDQGVLLDAHDDVPGGFRHKYTAFVQLRMSNGAPMRLESTHFSPAWYRDIPHDQMRREHATSIVQRARSLQTRAIPAVFGGDYNFTGDPFEMQARGNLRMRKDGIDGFYISGRRVGLVEHTRINSIRSDTHHPRLLVVDLPGR